MGNLVFESTTCSHFLVRRNVLKPENNPLILIAGYGAITVIRTLLLMAVSSSYKLKYSKLTFSFASNHASRLSSVRSVSAVILANSPIRLRQ